MTTIVQKIEADLLNVKSTLFIEASVLHRILRISEPFNLWISNRIKKWEYVENADYKKVTLKDRIDEKICDKTEYYISVLMAKELSITENSEEGIEAARIFRKILSGLIQPFANKDFQKDFADMINENNETVQLCPF
ncbi:MAG: antA/AntB antirepressor family protein [Bacteroidales bacterium]|nr:antA/AntB antirepressor family protein [Bacteroidales bacterium]